jgi:phospholipase A1
MLRINTSFLLLFSIVISLSTSLANDLDQKTKLILGNDSQNKFSYYEPTYLLFGKDDQKMQISGKYRFAKKLDLYFGFTQTMFWSIYITSQPFKDINYHPEIFYRLVDKESNNLKSLDVGLIHSSNGKDGESSRSINRIYVKTNYAAKIHRHSFISEFRIYDVVTHEETNKDLKKYLGYWDFSFKFTHVIIHQSQRLDLELKIFAGNRFVNFNKGARSIGAIYDFGSDHFNPSLYLQYFSGYVESLLGYNKYSEQLRLGFLFLL